jgi:hypothetical protein
MFQMVNTLPQKNMEFLPFIQMEEGLNHSIQARKVISNKQPKHNISQSNKEAEFQQNAEQLLIEISGAIPRKILIRKLLLLIFPDGLELISIRKICRAPLDDLLLLIGMYITEIKNSLTQNILDQYMQICIDLLANTQRKQKSDLPVLRFAKKYFVSHQKKGLKTIPSISNILKELNTEVYFPH